MGTFALRHVLTFLARQDKRPMTLKIQVTDDGSTTLFSEQFNEIYHSRHGAWQESQHVFIEAGLKHQSQQLPQINLLEVGFGTGLNALLTLAYLQEINPKEIKIYYTGLEPLPVGIALIKELHFPQMAENTELLALLEKIHQVKWEQAQAITPNFELTKINTSLQTWQASTQFDLVYFDAFAPSKHPEMWEQDIFEKLYEIMNPKGVLVTYCAKGSVKRNLKAAGFAIEALPGPPRKREMTRATKI